MHFEFATATRIIFGAGSISTLPTWVKSFGTRAFVVTGAAVARIASILEALHEAGIETDTFSVPGEPTLATAQAGIEAARAFNASVVIGIGGGSVIDAGKAIATLLGNGGDPLDYVEIVGRGQPVLRPAAPYIAIPTTSGTGAEVTANAVLSSPEHRLKVSMRSPFMLPRIALIDPELTYTLPPEPTAFTGMDALTQNIEPFVSNKANPLTDGFTREGIMRAGRALRVACDTGDPAAREDMALASVLGGLALANAKLGAVHGFASPIGGMCDAPHGAICAALLPPVMEANIRALRERAPNSPALARYQEIAQILTGSSDARAEQGGAWVAQLARDTGIQSLSHYGLQEADLPEVVEKAAVASSMQGNPIVLTQAELADILQRAY